MPVHGIPFSMRPLKVLVAGPVHAGSCHRDLTGFLFLCPWAGPSWGGTSDVGFFFCFVLLGGTHRPPWLEPSGAPGLSLFFTGTSCEAPCGLSVAIIVVWLGTTYTL